MKIVSAWSTNQDEIGAVNEVYSSLIDKLGESPDLMLVHCSCDYDNSRLMTHLRELAPDIPFQGGTSCLGVMTEAGFHSSHGKGLGILGISDPEGGYGVGIVEVDSDVDIAVKNALNAALTEARRPGELPSAVIVSNYPGHEESVIRAVESHFGSRIPIIGGTTADNDMSGQWQQFGNGQVYRKAVSIAVLFPTREIGYSFHSGYEPCQFSGKVTRAEGRILYEVDGRPFAEVYNEWTSGLIDEVMDGGGSLVPTASFTPVGRPVEKVGDITYHVLSYPVEVLPDHSVLLFTEINEGDEIVLMRGTQDSLVSRAGRVAKVAVDAANFDSDDIDGALVLFCTGCMLGIQSRMSEVVDGIRSSLKNAPFLSAFTLGEQGCFLGGESRHGNLMVAVLVFGPPKAEVF